MRKPSLLALSAPALLVTLCACGSPFELRDLSELHVPDAPDSPTSAANSEPSGTSIASAPLAAPTWTVLVYAQGDNARSAALASDLEQIKGAALGPNVKVVVLADWNAGLVDALARPLFTTGTERYTFGAGTASTPAREVEQDFDDPRVLSSAIAHAFKDYPADRHAVVIWSRGGNERSMLGADVQDTARPNARGMSLATLKGAVRDGVDAGGLSGSQPLDVLGFDLSSPGRLEDAYAMKDLAKVYISNAAADGDGAWAYREALGYLGTNPGATAADFATFEAEAWRAKASASGTLPRAHIAIDTNKLGDLARATDALVLAIAAKPSAMPRVAFAASTASDEMPGGQRRLDYARFASTLASGPDLGAVTVAADAAVTQFTRASIGAPDGSAAFSVALPTSQATTSAWFEDYLSRSDAWYGASRWDYFLGLWAVAHDNTALTIDASIHEPNPWESQPSTRIVVDSSGPDGFLDVLLSRREGDVVTTYGSVAFGSFTGSEGAVVWTKRIGTVGGQPARGVVWSSFNGARTALMGRLTLGQRSVDAAVVMGDGGTSNVFVLQPGEVGGSVNAAALLAIDPNATFMPSVVRTEGGASHTVYGTPIALTKVGVVVGSAEMQPGSYELHVEARNGWGTRGHVVRPFVVATH